MSAMEQSLRRALEAGDAADPVFRESIYSASERALERMIEARRMDEDAAQLQRIRLAETINRVEEDHFAAAEGGVGASADADGGHASEAANPPDDDPPSEAAVPAALERPETVSLRERADDDEVWSHGIRGAEDAPPPAERPVASRWSDDAVHRESPSSVSSPRQAAKEAAARPRRRRMSAALALLAVLALAVGGYLAYGSLPRPASGTSPAPGSAAGGTGQPSSEPAGDWIDLFTGTQLESISTRLGATADQVTGAEQRRAVRLAAPGEGGEVGIAIGPGVVGEIAGKTVRVEIAVGSPDAAERVFRVRCVIGEEPVCGPQRFTTALESQIFIFDMVVPAGARAQGEIAIDPGFGTPAKAIDLYSVRVRTDLPS